MPEIIRPSPAWRAASSRMSGCREMLSYPAFHHGHRGRVLSTLAVHAMHQLRRHHLREERLAARCIQDRIERSRRICKVEGRRRAAQELGDALSPLTSAARP